MNWFVLVYGKLVCIGNCGDWVAASEVADECFGRDEWHWLVSSEDVQQWAKCIKEAE
jgi:hypothetical protein